MLAEEIQQNKELVSVIQSPKYAMEQKFDGRRMIVTVKDGESTAFSRKGEQIEVPLQVAAFFDKTNLSDISFDGEWLGHSYVIFDVIMKDVSYLTRRNLLDRIAERIPSDSYIKIAPVWFEGKNKRFVDFSRAKVEGVVFKNVEGKYREGRSRDVLKFKFTKTADVIVSKLNRNDTSQGVTIVCWDNGKEHEVGGCKIPEHVLYNLEEGDIIEIRYLYATESNKVVQPVFLRLRDDKTSDECLVSQLIKTNKEIQV